MLPDVSVIIPAHNEERYLARCLRSILNQTLEINRFEVIAINDSSTDRTQQILEQFSDSIRIIHSKENVGLPAALNMGVKSAHGRFVVRLDADDYVSSEYLKILSLFLTHNPHMDAVACDYFLVNEAEEVLKRANCEVDPLGCGIMFRMEQLVSIGLYDETFRMHEDRDLRIRFLSQYQIHRVELPLYRYRRHSENMTNNRELSDVHLERLLEKHGEK